MKLKHIFYGVGVKLKLLFVKILKRRRRNWKIVLNGIGRFTKAHKKKNKIQVGRALGVTLSAKERHGHKKRHITRKDVDITVSFQVAEITNTCLPVVVAV